MLREYYTARFSLCPSTPNSAVYLSVMYVRRFKCWYSRTRVHTPAVFHHFLRPRVLFPNFETRVRIHKQRVCRSSKLLSPGNGFKPFNRIVIAEHVYASNSTLMPCAANVPLVRDYRIVLKYLGHSPARRLGALRTLFIITVANYAQP